MISDLWTFSIWPHKYHNIFIINFSFKRIGGHIWLPLTPNNSLKLAYSFGCHNICFRSRSLIHQCFIYSLLMPFFMIYDQWWEFKTQHFYYSAWCMSKHKLPIAMGSINLNMVLLLPFAHITWPLTWDKNSKGCHF